MIAAQIVKLHRPTVTFDAMSNDSILVNLKSQTQPLHQQLEARVEVLRRLETRELYANLLAAFFGFYQPLEVVLATVPGIDTLRLDLPARRKVPWLERDLAALGISSNVLPRCQNLPAIDSCAAALGCCYVLEGATLGGQVIDRLLRQTPRIERTSGGAFFNSYGDEVGSMWNRFRVVVTDFAQTSDEQASIIASAQQTFALFDAWLESQLIPLD